MPLKITRAEEPIVVERLNVVLYGPPGIGKTSTAFTAESPLMLDFDRGAHRAVGRKDTVQVSSWSDVADIRREDMEGYKTLIVDTAGRALDALTVDIIRRDAKAGKGGTLTLQGYGKLKGEFGAWLKQVNSFGLDVVLIAHMDEQRSGDDIIERLDVQGGSKNELYKAADAMGRLAMREGRRLLTFSPTDAAFGKNPGQLEPMVVPANSPDFLAGVIASIKTKLNEAGEAQAKAAAELAQWKEYVDGLESPAEFTAAIEQAKKVGKAASALLNAQAQARGYVYDKNTKAYAEKVAQ